MKTLTTYIILTILLIGINANAQTPTISSFSPSSGCAGSIITITGTNLSSATSITIGGVAVASVTSITSTQINAEVGNTGIGVVAVTTSNGTATSTSSFTVYPMAIATFSYTGTPYCQSAANPTPTYSGGGTAGNFSSTPGLTFINSNNGIVNLAGSNPGTYTVTNTIPASGTCLTGTATSTITINALQDASFSYSSHSYCHGSANPAPTITGTAGGTFTASPAGLIFISASTGQINLATSNAGSYTIMYTTPGPSCINSSTTNITIGNSAVATFSYAGTPYCQSAANPTPTYSGGGVAGTFSSTAGLSFLSTATGQVNLSVSNPGTYTVTNTIPASGGCPAITATSTITINALQDASFNYSSSSYCQSSPYPIPTITGIPGGTFTCSAGFVFISTSTGEIDLTNGTTGTDVVRYTTPGPCASYSTSTITINSLPTVTLIPTPATCINNGSITATPTGGASPFTYLWSTTNTSAAISGLNVGTYTVTITDHNGCSAINTATVNNAGVAAPSICEVSIDSIAGSNQYVQIYWDKTVFGANIDSVIAYRYSPIQATYLRIGSVPNNNSTLSKYTDTARSVGGPHGGDPTFTYFKYKIALHDTCGNISALSNYHESVNFYFVSGTTFQWNPYVIENGAAINGYNLMKDSLSNGNWQLITSTVGTTAADPNYSSSLTASYRVDALGFNCVATRTPMMVTHSNIKQTGITTGISQEDLNNDVTIYPNPFTSQTTISFSSEQTNTLIKITDVIGKEIKIINFTGKQYILEKGTMKSGIYFVQITSFDKLRMTQVVENRKIVVRD